MNSFLFIDLELLEWNGKGDLPVPHFKAMKFSNFLRIKGNRTDLIYKKNQLDLIPSYDFIIVCTHGERILPDYLMKIENKKILTFDSQLDYQIEYMGLDDSLYAEMISEFLFERNYSVNRLIWHSAASLIKISKDDEIVNTIDDLYTKSKNYICLYDADFLSLIGWQDIIEELEEKQKKYRFAFPLNIDSIENLEDAMILSDVNYMVNTSYTFYSGIDNEKRKIILELNRYKSNLFKFNVPDFEYQRDMDYWIKALKFTIKTYYTVRELGGECKINLNKEFEMSPIIFDILKLFISYANTNFYDLSFDDYIRRNVDVLEYGKPLRMVRYELFLSLFNDNEFNDYFNKKICKNVLYY